MSPARPILPPAWATVEDLARTPGKAEPIGGRIVPLMPTGHGPNRAAVRPSESLGDHAGSANGRWRIGVDRISR